MVVSHWRTKRGRQWQPPPFPVCAGPRELYAERDYLVLGAAGKGAESRGLAMGGGVLLVFTAVSW